MLLDALLFALGLGVLYVGAEWLVKGASAIALQFGIRPLVVGLTIVALGTSMPELLLNVFAVYQDQDALAVGNIVGSNIANIALILGVSALLLPLYVERRTLAREYPMMLGATLLFWILASDGMLTRRDGIALVACLFAFLAYVIHNARSDAKAHVKLEKEPPSETGPRTWWQTFGATTRGRIAFVIAGMALLAMGADLMVDSAVALANDLGVHPGIIGLTVVAIGTSLPELAASVVGALQDEADLSVGNVLGSNMLNILFVVGLVALMRPMAVDPVALEVHFPIMIGFTIILLPIAFFQGRISRTEGGLLLIGFSTYLVYLIAPYL